MFGKWCRIATRHAIHVETKLGSFYSKPGMSCADNLRRFRTNLLLPSLGRNSRNWGKGGRENGCNVDDFKPFLLFLDRLGSTKFVPNQRKNDLIDANYQHTTSLFKAFCHQTTPWLFWAYLERGNFRRWGTFVLDFSAIKSNYHL